MEWASLVATIIAAVESGGYNGDGEVKPLGAKLEDADAIMSMNKGDAALDILGRPPWRS